MSPALVLTTIGAIQPNSPLGGLTRYQMIFYKNKKKLNVKLLYYK